MPIRTTIIVKDRDLGQLLQSIVQERGHETRCFDHPNFCSVYSDEDLRCSHSLSCCDILIVDYETPWMTSLDLIEEQTHKGCLLSPRNKAFLSVFDDLHQTNRARGLGCHSIPKPFRLKVLIAWLAECEERVALGRHLASLQVP